MHQAKDAAPVTAPNQSSFCRQAEKAMDPSASYSREPVRSSGSSASHTENVNGTGACSGIPSPEAVKP